jgi:hypothetical protein
VHRVGAQTLDCPPVRSDAGRPARRPELVPISTREYACCWTVADQADQPSLQLTFAVAATCRRDLTSA